MKVPYSLFKASGVLILTLSIIFALAATASSSAVVIFLVSTSSTGEQTTGGGINGGSSSFPRVSADGQYVVFFSDANNLVPGMPDGFDMVYRKNMITNEVELVSSTPSGEPANAYSYFPDISADGRYVSFISLASNLGYSGGTGGMGAHLYVKDMERGTVTHAGPSNSDMHKISADGRYVAYNAYPSDEETQFALYKYDVNAATKTPVIADVATDYNAAISADGRFVSFDDGNSVYVKDTFTDTFELVSSDAVGNEGNGIDSNSEISADGRYVVFSASSNNLVPDDTNDSWDLFRKDTATGAVMRLNTDSAGNQTSGSSQYSFYSTGISADGRFVTFDDLDDNLVSNDSNEYGDVFVKDTETGATSRLSTDESGNESNSGSGNPAISADGFLVAFASIASNLVPDDVNARADVFLALNDLPFIAGRPDLDTWDNGVYWQSYADYLSRDLSVDFNIYNAGINSAFNLQITSSSQSGNVKAAVPFPIFIGELHPGQTQTITIKYFLPVGTAKFYADISALAEDSIGLSYVY